MGFGGTSVGAFSRTSTSRSRSPDQSRPNRHRQSHAAHASHWSGGDSSQQIAILRRSGGHALQLERELRLHRTGRATSFMFRPICSRICLPRARIPCTPRYVYVIAMSGSSIQKIKKPPTRSGLVRILPDQRQDGSAAMIRFSMSTKIDGRRHRFELGLDRFGRLRVRFRQADKFPGYWVACIGNEPTMMRYSGDTAVVLSGEASPTSPFRLGLLRHPNSPHYKKSEKPVYPPRYTRRANSRCAALVAGANHRSTLRSVCWIFLHSVRPSTGNVRGV